MNNNEENNFNDDDYSPTIKSCNRKVFKITRSKDT